MSEVIHVYLPDELVDVWAPVTAEHVHDDIYRIIDCRGEDDAVQFGKGRLVHCRRQVMSGDGDKLEESLVAFEEAHR